MTPVQVAAESVHERQSSPVRWMAPRVVTAGREITATRLLRPTATPASHRLRSVLKGSGPCKGRPLPARCLDGLVLELSRRLTDRSLAAVADLERRVLAVDGGRLKLEWPTLCSRAGDRVEDLMWWKGERLVGFLGPIWVGGWP